MAKKHFKGKFDKAVNPELPPADIRISNFYEALVAFGINIKDPRYEQYICDVVIDIIMTAPKNY